MSIYENEDDIFPAWNYPSADWKDPFEVIAEKLQCSKDSVYQAFSGLEIPDWSDPKHLDRIQGEMAALNRARLHTEKLIFRLNELSDSSRNGLQMSACPNSVQLGLLVKELSGQKEYLERFSRNQSRQGGRNPGAYIVAEGMRRLFRRQRWKITWGQVEGFPSTKFGRAVEFGLNSFGILANWRGPTEEAFRRQVNISDRLFRMKNQGTTLTGNTNS